MRRKFIHGIRLVERLPSFSLLFPSPASFSPPRVEIHGSCAFFVRFHICAPGSTVERLVWSRSLGRRPSRSFAERACATLCLLNIVGISARGLIKKQLPLAAAGGARLRAAPLICRAGCREERLTPARKNCVYGMKGKISLVF